MTRWAPHYFKEQAAAAGWPAEDVSRFASQYEIATRQRIAPLLSLGHLAQSCGVPYEFLRGCCERRRKVSFQGQLISPYHVFAIRKRSGGKRVISVPSEGLMTVQRWIHRWILSGQPCHARAFAYQSGRSITDCASIHLGCRWMIKLDISNFFESITERQIYFVFRSLGYTPLVSLELARLCTRIDVRSKSRKEGYKWEVIRKTKAGRIPRYIQACLGYLPQGAPTSPALSNLVAHKMDASLNKLASDAGFEYSRYSDDMYFSSSLPTIKKSDAVHLARRASVVIEAAGFDLNRSKTAITGPGHRRIVLGLLVDGTRLRLGPENRRRIEWHYRHCLVDPTQHAVKKDFRSVLGLKNHLVGLMAYARAVDSTFAAKYEASQINWPV